MTGFLTTQLKIFGLVLGLIGPIGYAGTGDSQAKKNPLKNLQRNTQNQSSLTRHELEQILGRNPTDLGAFIDSLDLPKANDIYNAISRSDLFLNPQYQESVNHLSDLLGTKNRAVKVMSLPPYETLFILDEHNASHFLKTEGMLYSELKYGKPSVISHFSRIIAARIRARFGTEIAKKPEEWVVASAAYYRSPNAASYLGESVSNLLGLPLLDIRTRGIFTGEFGSVDAPEKRCQAVANKKMYISNPHLATGKKVIYIDDVYVSGANLIEHNAVLKEYGAKKIYPYAIFDVASKNLTLEASLNYAFVSQQNPDPLIEIINSPKTPILTRTAKFILRQNPKSLGLLLKKLPDERVFEILETAEAEGYGDQEVFAESYLSLQTEAQRRHNTMMRPLPSLFERNIRLMIVDYDQTLSPENRALSDETMEHLCAFLEQGISIAIVSLQPMNYGGLEQLVHRPMISYLLKQKKSRSILRNLHLFANGGTVYYQYTDSGQLNSERPVYNTAIPLSQEKPIEKIVLNSVGQLASRSFHRGSYTSIHFPDAASKDKGVQLLNRDLADYPFATIFNTHTTTPGKFSIRVGQIDRPKIIAKSYIMKHLRKQISFASRRPLLRSQIFTAGDKMGYSPEENSDSDFFIYGGQNLALGKEARQGAYKSYLNMNSQGLNNWFKSYRSQKKF